MSIGYKKAGFYTSKNRAIFWNLKNDNGQNVSKGLYFVKLKGGKFLSIKSLVVE